MNGAFIISTRNREVWTLDEKKHLDRCAKDVNSHNDKLQLVCGNQTCPDRQIVLARDQTAPGGIVLRCGCKDRIVETRKADSVRH